MHDSLFFCLPDRISLPDLSWKSTFRIKASPGRGKLSPQVTDEGAGKQLLPKNYPSSGATRHLPPKG